MWWKIVHSRCLIFGRYFLFKETGPYFSLLFSPTQIFDSMTAWLCNKIRRSWETNEMVQDIFAIYLLSSLECNEYFKDIPKKKSILYTLKMHSKSIYRV